MSQPQLSPIFIGGHRKCGTTLLLNLLDGHPELCVYPIDLTMLYAYFPVYEDEKFSQDERKERLDTVVFKKTLADLSEKLDVSSFRTRFLRRMESKPYVSKDILRELLLAYREFTGLSDDSYRGTVVKESSIEIYARYLFEWFPNAKFLHLIRDPRDNFGALRVGIQEYYRHFGDDSNTILHSLLERAHLGMQMADINQARLGQDSYKIVRFEDLVTTPSETLNEISEFLGISYHESLMVPTLLGNPTRGNSFEKLDFSKVSATNIGRWSERILPEEAKIIEFHFRDLMDRFDYDLAYSETEQADATTEYYKWSNYKYHFFDHFAENGES